MNVSDLQKFILKKTYIHGPQCKRSVFDAYYSKKGEQEVKIVTRSLERLISRGLLVGYGHKTAEKFFIDSVRLTPKGQRLAVKIAHDMARLPFPPRRR